MKIKIKIPTLILSIASFILFAASSANAKIVNYYEMLELRQNMPTAIVIDSRPDKEFDGNMVRGARHFPVDEMTEEKLLQITGNSKSTPLIFYCTGPTSNFSGHAILKAKSRGFFNVFRYMGGILDYNAKNYTPPSNTGPITTMPVIP